ncbi:MAG: V-type ATP synthase subunit A [Candidatus Thorarchaeota archaeon]
MNSNEYLGRITRVIGPVVHAEGLSRSKKNSIVFVGEDKLFGEIVQILGNKAVIQVYEKTSGLGIGEPVQDLNRPLSLKLGPGLLGNIIDGVQRQLKELGYLFIEKGMSGHPLPTKTPWHFIPEYEKIDEMEIGEKAASLNDNTIEVKPGDKLKGGEILGYVQETDAIKHFILNPPSHQGIIEEINEGKYTIEDPIGHYKDGTPIMLYHHWPVRIPRPFQRRVTATHPFITGQRVLDFLYPIIDGGTAMIPGGFGTGKTVLEQTLAKFSSADITILTLCGERGNEIADVLSEFKHLTDPLTRRPMSERSIIIANTSNMPVAAREASIYSGITLAEYFRDMGFKAAVTADSTSRWAEALREVSVRLEEVPGEKGYPSYLPKLIGRFYERAGKVKTQSNRIGSVTVIGAVSPPGGDFSDPVSQYTLRYANALWGLDVNLARQRHYPAINLEISFTQYLNEILAYWDEQPDIGEAWSESRRILVKILRDEVEIEKIVRLIGKDTLTEPQLGILAAAELIRDGFLRQSAYSDIDGYCTIKKTYEMALTLQMAYEWITSAIKSGHTTKEIFEKEKEIFEHVNRLKELESPKKISEVRNIIAKKLEAYKKQKA